MCGIFGAIGHWNEGTVRALAIANRERGKDSLGWFDSHGHMIKGAGDPLVVLAKPHIRSWFRGDRKKNPGTSQGWFIAGHTRLGTRGAAVRRNAHPFRYGHVIGAHNGMVDAPQSYEVDSMYLFDLLNKYDSDYNKALVKVSGYWGLSWFDGRDFYLQCHDGELALVHNGAAWYYASDDDHIKACVPCDHDKIHIFTEGETWKFSADGFAQAIDPFVSKAAQYWTKGSSYSRYNYSTGSDRAGSHMGGSSHWWDDDEYTADNDVRDYDSEWREAWANYTNESEHSKID